MYIFSAQFLDDMVSRLTGPMSFRFVFQPIAAIMLGVRDGINDARTGRPPIGVALLFESGNRLNNLKSVGKSLMWPIVIGTVLDAIAQHLIFHHIRPGIALVVGTFIMAIPYSFARGLTNRFITARNKGK